MENTTSIGEGVWGESKHNPRRHPKKKKDQGPPLYSVIKKHEFTNPGVAVNITAAPNNEISPGSPILDSKKK